MNVLKAVERINSIILDIEEWILTVIVIIMVVLSFVQVILRNIFSEGLLWGDIFLRHLVLWVGFIGASIATRYEKHITIDLFGRLIKGRLLYISRSIILVFSAFASSWLTLASWQFLRDEQDAGSIIFANIPVWYFQIIIPAGFALITLRFLVQSIEFLLRAISEERFGK